MVWLTELDVVGGSCVLCIPPLGYALSVSLYTLCVLSVLLLGAININVIAYICIYKAIQLPRKPRIQVLL